MEVGRNTPKADAAGMGYTDGSCYGDKHGHGALPAHTSGWEIKERRGGPLDELDVRATMFAK